MTLSLVIATAISVEFANKPALADCNSVSYWQTSNGTCVDLSSFSQLGSIQAELSKPPVFGNKNVDITNLRLVPNSIGVDIKGTVKNISQQSIEVGMIDYELVNSNGVPIHDGTFVVSKNVRPGQTIAISAFATSEDLEGYRASNLSVRVLKMW
ncbi:hypothetical protein FACHB389_30240 [Nostoc calcicola FACHB-389]|nr:hypothetical protein FACHB389_30240 [Nostoc calcicola FACHB-389]